MMFIGRWCLLVLLVGSFCEILRAEEIVDCSNEEVVTSLFNEPIELTHSGPIHVYANVSINNITATTNNEFDRNYIDARLEPASDDDDPIRSNLIIYTTEHFRRYAAEQTAVRITLKIVFACDMGRERTLIFFQPIKEGNYYRPQFSRDTYDLIMPTPIFAGFDLTTLMEITAKDDDLSANYVTFSSSDSEQFFIQVSTKNDSSDDKKTFHAELRLQRIYLALATELRFQITATDNGEPPLSSNATVVVRTDPAISLPPTPRFQETLVPAFLEANLTLTPFRVKLLPETYNQDVEFAISGVDSRLFRYENEANEVIISLAVPLNTSDTRGKPFLRFDLTASNRNLAEGGRTAVVVGVPRTNRPPEHFHFERNHYEGAIDGEGRLTVEAIHLRNASSYSEDVAFQLGNATADGWLFQLQQNVNGTVALTLSSNFSMDLLEQRTHFVVQIEALLRQHKTTTLVYIATPKGPPTSPQQSQQFAKAIYNGRILENPLQLQIEKIFLLQSTNESVEFELLGDHRELFITIPMDHSVILLLKRRLSSAELRETAMILLTLRATASSNSTAETVIAIETPSARPRIFMERVIIAKMQFDASGVANLQTPTIMMAKNQSTNEFSFSLEGPESGSFNITPSDDDHMMLLFPTKPIPAESLQTESHLQLTIKAVNRTDATHYDSIPILVELPQRVCSTDNITHSVPEFSSDEYIFTARPNQVGDLGFVSAIVRSPTARLQYQLGIEDEHLSKRMTINAQSGALVLLTAVNPGVYRFNITAENLEASLEPAATTVQGRLDVNSLVQCSDDSIRVANTLLVKHLLEEQPHHDVLNMSAAASLSTDACRFHVESFQPNDKGYVYVNATTGMLSTVSLDRESLIFAAMPQPRIQVKLRLLCDNDDEFMNNATEYGGDGAATTTPIIPENIPYTQDVTYLELLIDDINDNAPQFEHPTETLHLGFPEPSISVHILPQYLTQVHATDRDAGDNARIRYSMRANQHFDIDPETGIVYPKANAMLGTDPVELAVEAADRSGEAGEQTLRTIAPRIMVHRLGPQHFTLVTFKASSQLSLEQQIQNLSQTTGLDITPVRQGILPSVQNPRRRARQAEVGDEGAENIVQHAWVYAFNNGQPLDWTQLQNQLETDDSISLESYADAVTGGSTSNDSSSQPIQAASDSPTPYIVAIVILSLIALSTGGYLLWRSCRSRSAQAAREADNQLTDFECESVARRSNACNNDVPMQHAYDNDSGPQPEDPDKVPTAKE